LPKYLADIFFVCGVTRGAPLIENMAPMAGECFSKEDPFSMFFSWASLATSKVGTHQRKNLRKALEDWQKKLSSLKTNISNVKSIIFFTDIIEEYRDLTLIEWNFIEALKQKLNDLLDQQKIYWKQRWAIKWVKLGDTNTKFFHANATIRHKGNMISQPISNSGTALYSHNDKETLIWHEFKERMAPPNSLVSLSTQVFLCKLLKISVS